MKLGIGKVAPDQPQRLVALEQRTHRPLGGEAERATEVSVLDQGQLRLVRPKLVIALFDRRRPVGGSTAHGLVLVNAACTLQSLSDRWRISLRAGGEGRIPFAHRRGVPEGRAGELRRESVRIRVRADVLPVEHELAQLTVPMRCLGSQVSLGEIVGRRVREGEECGAAVVTIARPPADLELLRIRRVPRYEVIGRWIGCCPEKRAAPDRAIPTTR